MPAAAKLKPIVSRSCAVLACVGINSIVPLRAEEAKNNKCTAVVVGNNNATSISCDDAIWRAKKAWDRATKEHSNASQGQIEGVPILIASGLKFDGSDASGVYLEGTDLTRGSFVGAIFHLTDLKGAHGSDFNAAGSGLRFSNLAGAMFVGSNFSNVYAPFIQGRGMSIESSKLSTANFFGGSLSQSSFRKSDLSYASFAFCDLRGADFRNADLTGADLEGALLTGATFEGAVLNHSAVDGAMDGAFSAEQKKGICRAIDPAEGEGFIYGVKVAERWPDPDQAEAFNHDMLFDEGRYILSYRVDAALSVCSKGAQEAAGGSRGEGLQITLLLDRDYMEIAGRESFVTQVVRQQTDLISGELARHLQSSR